MGVVRRSTWIAVAMLAFCTTASAQFTESITGFETNREGVALPFQPASFNDLQVVLFQDPRENNSTQENVVIDTSACCTNGVGYKSSEETFVANFSADFFLGHNGSNQFEDIRFEWANSNGGRTVIVETLQSPNLGDPSLHLNGIVRLWINIPDCSAYEFTTLTRSPSLGVALLIRETGKAVPQGFQDFASGRMEFVGVDSIDTNGTAPVIVPTNFYAITDADCSGSGGDWIQLTFDLDALETAGKVVGWPSQGGDGTLDATDLGDGVNRGVLAGLILAVPAHDTTSDYVEFLVDDIEFEAPVVDPAYPPSIGTPVVEGQASVRVKGILSSATNVSLEIDRSDLDNEDAFVADETYNQNPSGALYLDMGVPTLAVGDRVRARQTNPSGTSGYSLVITVNPPAAFSLTLSLDEDGILGLADFEWVGATSVTGTAGTQGKPIFPQNGVWQNIEFSLIPGVEPVISFAGGNGQLQPDGGNYLLDSLFFTIDPTNPSTGPYNIFLDHVYIINASDQEVLIADVESANPFANVRGQSTATSTSSIISALASYDGDRSNRLGWSFPDTSASNTFAPYRPAPNFADTAKAVGMWLLVEDARTNGLPLPSVEHPIVGNAPLVTVFMNTNGATSATLLVNGVAAGSSPVAGQSEIDVDPTVTLNVGDSVSAYYTTAGGDSDWAYARAVIVPLAPTLATPLVPSQTSVTVNGVLTAAHATATTVTVYVNSVFAGSAAGGTASVVVTVPALVNGDVVTATQTVNGLEGTVSAPVTVAVPAPVTQGPLSATDTQVTVTGLHPSASTCTVYVNAATYPVATGGAASVIVTVPALASGDVVKATQTIATIEGPFSNVVVVANFVKINEFQYDDASTDNYQFIELYNGGPTAVNIGNWVLEVGDIAVYYTYTIPAGTTIAAGGYWVVGQTAVSTVPGAVVNQVASINLGDSGYGGAGNAANGEMYIALRNPSLVMLDATSTEMNKRITPGPAGATADVVAQIGTGIWGNTVFPDTPVADLCTYSRFLDGLDTDNNGRDWGYAKATPGFSNNQPDLMPYSENANALVPPAAVPNWVYSYKPLRAKDPTVADTINPAAIPASPDGGNVMIAWDESGGGSCAYLSQLAKEDFTLETYIYIPPTYSPVGFGYEDGRIGIRGMADGVINLGDPGGMTGLEWFWQRGESWQILYLLDENDGDDTGLLGYSYAHLIGSIAIAQNDPATTGWQRLLLESQGDQVRGIFGGTYGSRGDGIKISGTHQSTGPGGVYVGYRETMTGTGVPNNRPPTLDAFTLKAPPVRGDMDNDGDVDLTDLGKFVQCLNGPDVNTPPVGCTLNEFGLADLTWDNDVDLADFGEFQMVY